jgi:hypothetical protein
LLRSRLTRYLVSGVCSLLGVSWARTAGARAPRLEFSWQAPAECPDEARVRAQIERLVRSDDTAERAPLQAHASVERAEDGGWVLRLELLSGSARDERELVGDSCQALVDAVAVMLALQLSSEKRDDEVPRAAAEEPPAAAPASVLPPPAPERDRRSPSSPTSTRERGHWHLGVLGQADSVVLPEVAFGGRVDVGWALGRWYLGLSPSLWAAQEQALRDGGTGRGRFGFRALSVSGCHATWGSGARLGPCLSAEVGQLSAESSAVRLPDQVTELWVAALGGVGFWVPLGPGSLFTSGLSAVVPLRRPSFVVEGIGQIHQPSAVGGRASLGLAARF